MIRIDSSTPLIGYGSLTLDDLALRADQAYADHIATYDATDVLHRALAALPEYDQEAAELVDEAITFIHRYREKTRHEWAATYRTWAAVAGIEIPPDLQEDLGPDIRDYDHGDDYDDSEA
ncbi:hypothetical protein [Pseudofrankia inefficax]|uniref:Uncharacterized protein n=1 Tax=Pseudofrankia inefficax (strain DSM 45817 / CECT 9037 / DDB 130130 / EuI1c) TaxID=298654 RepID=E3J6C6_PSEI1|nr:hypothetical protein [Pseudofrankia inefficax]ADP79553.1 hypothetical protein FraEuI1c_1491 [Pseudofrankia inefficax]